MADRLNPVVVEQVEGSIAVLGRVVIGSVQDVVVREHPLPAKGLVRPLVVGFELDLLNFVRLGQPFLPSVIFHILNSWPDHSELLR